MAGLTGLYNTQGMLFLLLLLGVFFRKKNYITAEGEKSLNNVALFAVIPAMIFKSFDVQFNAQIVHRFFSAILISCGVQLMSAILSEICYRDQTAERRKVLKFATLASNCALLGMPVAEGMLGPEALTLAAVFLIPQRVVMWSLGISYFTTAPTPRQMLKKTLLQPNILATALGLVLLVTQFPIPAFCDMALSKLSASCTALAMLLVGCIVARMDIRTLAEPTVLRFTAIRLLLIPALVAIMCLAVGADPMTTKLSVAMAGMPGAANTAILASRYDGDEILAGKIVVFSTLLSMITIPLHMTILAALPVL